MRKIHAAETTELGSESDLSENEPSEVVENTEVPAAQDPSQDTPTDVTQEEHPHDESLQNNPATDVTVVGHTTTDFVVTEAITNAFVEFHCNIYTLMYFQCFYSNKQKNKHKQTKR